MNEFECLNCGKKVVDGGLIGTKNRNHCPYCLCSLHVDLKVSGDRLSDCKSLMKPIGLTFKHVGFDKFAKPRQGELMLIHKCSNNDKISINRIAADDDPEMILKVLKSSENINSKERRTLENQEIRLLGKSDKNQVLAQLFGKNYLNK